jgi:hypothetical protein
VTRIAIWLLLAIAIIGCAPTASSRAKSSSTLTTARHTPGLLVEQWQFQSDDGRLDAAVSELMPDETEPIHGEAGFRRDGFRVVLLDAEGADALRVAMASESPTQRIRHGEAVAWRDLLTRSIEQNTVVLENGRARRLPRSIVALAARGWSVPTVQGAGVHVQIVPYLIAQRASSRADLRPGELRGRPFANAIEATLDEHTILIVTSDPALRATGEEPRSESSSFFPSTGPNAPLPPTVAELLLDGDNGRTRGVLVIRGTPNSAFKPSARMSP